MTRAGDTSGATTVTPTAAIGTGAATPPTAADFGGTLPAGTVTFAAGADLQVCHDQCRRRHARRESDEGFTVTLSNASGERDHHHRHGHRHDPERRRSRAVDRGRRVPARRKATRHDAVHLHGDAHRRYQRHHHGRLLRSTGSGGNPANGGGLRRDAAVRHGDVRRRRNLQDRHREGRSATATSESDEGFPVTLSNAARGATITTATATGTIQNDDAADAVDRGRECRPRPKATAARTPFTFTVTRAGDTSGATTVSYAVTGTGVNPANAADFGGTLPSGTVTFAAGETAKTVTINVAGDTHVENRRRLHGDLSNASGGATITTATASGTIQNDDADRRLSIAATSAVKAEGNSGTHAVHLHGDAHRRHQRRDHGQLRGHRHRRQPGQRRRTSAATLPRAR